MSKYFAYRTVCEHRSIVSATDEVDAANHLLAFYGEGVIFCITDKEQSDIFNLTDCDTAGIVDEILNAGDILTTSEKYNDDR